MGTSCQGAGFGCTVQQMLLQVRKGSVAQLPPSLCTRLPEPGARAKLQEAGNPLFHLQERLFGPGMRTFNPQICPQPPPSGGGHGTPHLHAAADTARPTFVPLHLFRQRRGHAAPHLHAVAAPAASVHGHSATHRHAAAPPLAAARTRRAPPACRGRPRDTVRPTCMPTACRSLRRRRTRHAPPACRCTPFAWRRRGQPACHCRPCDTVRHLHACMLLADTAGPTCMPLHPLWRRRGHAAPHLHAVAAPVTQCDPPACRLRAAAAPSSAADTACPTCMPLRRAHAPPACRCRPCTPPACRLQIFQTSGLHSCEPCSVYTRRLVYAAARSRAYVLNSCPHAGVATSLSEAFGCSMGGSSFGVQSLGWSLFRFCMPCYCSLL